MSDLYARIQESAAFLRESGAGRPRAAVVLGSGLGGMSGEIEGALAIPFAEVPHFGSSTVDFHAGELIFGTVRGVGVCVLEGRLHYYEGHSMSEVVHPLRSLRALGADTVVLTSAVGGMNAGLAKGDILAVRDHINLMGDNPLIGPNDERIGPRFPDMSEPYSHHWIEMAREVALRGGIPCMPGVLAAVPGPSMPTRAEYRFMRQSGADLVSMSMVPEVIAAVHAGFQVLALVGITQQVLTERSTTVSIEAMIEAAEVATPRMGAMLVGVVAHSRDLLE